MSEKRELVAEVAKSLRHREIDTPLDLARFNGDASYWEAIGEEVSQAQLSVLVLVNTFSDQSLIEATNPTRIGLNDGQVPFASNISGLPDRLTNLPSSAHQLNRTKELNLMSNTAILLEFISQKLISESHANPPSTKLVRELKFIDFVTWQRDSKSAGLIHSLTPGEFIDLLDTFNGLNNLDSLPAMNALNSKQRVLLMATGISDTQAILTEQLLQNHPAHEASASQLTSLLSRSSINMEITAGHVVSASELLRVWTVILYKDRKKAMAVTELNTPPIRSVLSELMSPSSYLSEQQTMYLTTYHLSIYNLLNNATPSNLSDAIQLIDNIYFTNPKTSD